MTVNTPTARISLTQFSSAPCEGAEDITIDLRFDVDAEQIVDLSSIQGAGKWSGVETVYIDNSLNGSPIFIETAVARQTLTVPPNSCFLMPFLVPNPPKFRLTSAGGVIVRMNVLNYFFPPCVWSPTSPPGGGGSTGAGVTVTDFSGASPVTIPANPLRKYLLISTPVAAGVSSFFTIGGGGSVELTLGAVYENPGPSVPVGAIVITNASGNVIAYEGV